MCRRDCAVLIASPWFLLLLVVVMVVVGGVIVQGRQRLMRPGRRRRQLAVSLLPAELPHPPRHAGHQQRDRQLKHQHVTTTLNRRQ